MSHETPQETKKAEEHMRASGLEPRKNYHIDKAIDTATTFVEKAVEEVPNMLSRPATAAMEGTANSAARAIDAGASTIADGILKMVGLGNKNDKAH